MVAYDPAVTSGDRHTLLSVRGEAERTVAPDQVTIFSGVSATAASKKAAMAAATASLAEVIADLRVLGGEVLTVQNARAPLTWSTQSVRTNEECVVDKGTGVHGPTGRHTSTVSLLVAVRDFALRSGRGDRRRRGARRGGRPDGPVVR